ncbi:MAG TPA: SDR family NAD(P)-dependent oxidoreductase, partial [Ottowia sp.]|nr:SDR family NAD(P)-dependent oxidoreductase [Ottowia sp.]
MNASATASPDAAQPPRTVLVTGAARRLGREIAIAAARAGWRVAVHYQTSRQDAIDTLAACASQSSAGGIFDADLGDEAAARALLPRVVAELGAVDAVVNSAALFD